MRVNDRWSQCTDWKRRSHKFGEEGYQREELKKAAISLLAREEPRRLGSGMID